MIFAILNLLLGCAGRSLKPDEDLSYPTDTDSSSGTSTSPCVPDICDGILDPNAQPGDNPALCLSFHDTATDVGLESTFKHAGASVVDYDNDGFTDIFILNHEEDSDDSAHNQMFHNLGDGRFEDVTQDIGLDSGGDSRKAIFADYNDDGFPDLFLTSFSGTSVYDNDGGVFNLRGVIDAESAGAAAWLGSGLLLANNGHTHFYSYDGSSFSSEDPWEQAVAAGLDDQGTGAAIGLADYDGDHHDDIALVVNTGRDRLFKNRGDGTYQSVERDLGIFEDGNEPSTDVDWITFPQDSQPSIYVSAFGANQFLHNYGDDTLVDEAPTLGIDASGHTTQAAWTNIGVGVLSGFLGRYAEDNIFEYPIFADDGTISRFMNIAEALGMNDNGTTVAVEWLIDENGIGTDVMVAMYEGGLKLYHNDSYEVETCK